jgi:F0F1-type ATP synthase membrane subunit c/vacuolar-type H+-ATPase subunit K
MARTLELTSVLTDDFINSGCMHLAGGLSVGLSGLAAGYAIGIVGDMVRRDSLDLVD